MRLHRALSTAVLALAAAGVPACAAESNEDAADSQDAISTCMLEDPCGATLPLLKSVARGSRPSSLVRSDVTIDSPEGAVHPHVIQSSTSREVVTKGSGNAVLTGPGEADSFHVGDLVLVEALELQTNTRLDAFVVGPSGGHEVKVDGRVVDRIGADTAYFSPGTIDIAPRLWKLGYGFRLRVTSLTIGKTTEETTPVVLRSKFVAPPEPTKWAPAYVEYDMDRACPGPALTYDEAVATLGTDPTLRASDFHAVVIAGRERTCSDLGGCGEWLPSKSVPLFTVPTPTTQALSIDYEVPQRGTAWLTAFDSAHPGNIDLSFDATTPYGPGVAFALASVYTSPNTPTTNGLVLKRARVSEALVIGNSGQSTIWGTARKLTKTCVFAKGTGRSVEPGDLTRHTEHEMVVWGRF